MIRRASVAMVVLCGTATLAGPLSAATATHRPIAHEAARFKLCPPDPGGAFYNMRVKLVSCGRGEAILHRHGHGYGFHCHVVGHGPGGGFPATEYCRKGVAGADGDIVDGPSTS